MNYLYCLLLVLAGSTAFSQTGLYNWYLVGDTSHTDGTVGVLFNDGDGNLYAGGNFHTIGGEDIDLVAMWDGEKWNDLGFPTSGSINAIEKIGDTLYVAGNFENTANEMRDVARYYNGTWYPMGEGVRGAGGTPASVACMAAVGGAIYIGGDFRNAYQANGTTLEVNYIARWSGGEWHALGITLDRGLDSYVNAMQAHNGKLYVAGEFYETYNGSQEFDYVVEYDPSSNDWNPIVDDVTGDNGVDNYARSILVNDTAILVGGWFDQAGGKPAEYLARYAGGEWHAHYGSPLDDPADAMAFYEGQLYAGGSFQFDDPNNEEINDIAVLVDSNWYDLGVGLDYKPAGDVNDLAVFDSSLYIAGSFDGGGGIAAQNIIKVVKRDTSGSTGTSICDCGTGYRLYPNPARSMARLGVELNKPAQLKIALFNVMGQELVTLPGRHLGAGKHDVPIPLPDLPMGTYFVKVERPDGIHVMPLTVLGE